MQRQNTAKWLSVDDMKKIKSKQMKTLLIFLCAALGIGIAGCIYAVSVDTYIRKSGESQIVSSDYDAEQYGVNDCILVLGAGVHGETLSHMLEDRVKTGIALYQAGAAPKLLMSGDHGREDYDEVNAMKNYAKEQGIASSDVFMDHAGFSTYESLVRAKEIFGAKKIVIVSQKYHLYRALYIARSLGLDAVGVDAQLRPYAADTNIFNTLREFLARNKDFIYVKFNPSPTYLGEPIPINGDGDATNDKL